MSLQLTQDALKHLQIIRRHFTERCRFTGYSGGARITSGTLALFAALALSADDFPQSAKLHLACWVAVAVGAFSINLGAILSWFLRQAQPEERNWAQLAPVWFVMPPLIVGAILTIALALRQQFDLLFGVWMLAFSLTHYYSSHSVPLTAHRILTGFYFMAGLYCLIDPAIHFLDPLPMGLIFFAGELAGGVVFLFNRHPDFSLQRFMLGGKAH